VIAVNRLRVGVTHTQYSADTWNNRGAVASARELMRDIPVQNQHIMGWGADNPEPRPGVFDFQSLDERVAMIRASGATPVLTLCCAPDWMKGGAPGTTNWDNLETAPTPSHFADFARLAVVIARRYPDVKTFQVWNELKGFWDDRHNQWDAAAYTTLYNMVYDALKANDPSVKIGGPYVSLDTAPGHIDPHALDAIRYWLAHKHGADFLAVDGSLPTARALSPTLRAMTSLPVWWSEFYAVPFGPAGIGISAARQAAMTVSALLDRAWDGASVVLLWQPQAEGTDCAGCLWTDTRPAGGGRPTATGLDVADLALRLKPGTTLRPLECSNPSITGLVVGSTAVVVNQSAGRVDATVAGTPLTLAPWSVTEVGVSAPRSRTVRR
jgi:hypothetical protein